MSKRLSILAAGAGLGAITGLAISAFVGNPLVWIGICTLFTAEFASSLGKLE